MTLDEESSSWWNGETLAWLGIGSLATLVLAAILLPIIVIRMPADYFVNDRQPKPRSGWSLAGLVVRNILGGVLVLAGILMLVLPGQGVLTILIGLTWMDFPGKLRLEQAIVRRPTVAKALNWIRARWDKPPFEPVDGASPE